MTTLQPIEEDVQFMRLVRREHEVDLVAAALELARDGQQQLDFTPTLNRLRLSVSSLTSPITQAGSDLKELQILIRHMTDELNLHGDSACYEDPDASYLNRVLETGRGLPISLCVLYASIANELGMPMELIAAPSHFLTRLHTDAGTIYIDTFDSGRLMQEDECLEWLHDLTDIPTGSIQDALRPATHRAIVIRMLHNLKTVFGRLERWVSAWRVQKRLSLLSPGSFRERRDLAILTFRAGRVGEAVDLFETCLSSSTDEDRPMLQQYLAQARRGIPLTN